MAAIERFLEGMLLARLEIPTVKLLAENRSFDVLRYGKYRCNRQGQVMAGLRQ